MPTNLSPTKGVRLFGSTKIYKKKLSMTMTICKHRRENTIHSHTHNDDFSCPSAFNLLYAHGIGLITFYMYSCTGEMKSQMVREEDEQKSLETAEDEVADNDGDGDIYPSNIFCF